MPTKRQRGSTWTYTIKRAKMLAKPVNLTFDTEAEGDRECARLERLLDAGIMPPEILELQRDGTELMDLRQAVRMYEAAVSVPHSDAEALGVVLGRIGKKPVAEMSITWAEDWVKELKRVDRLAPSSIRTYVGALARCMDWHVRRKSVAHNPIRQLPRKYAVYNDADRRYLESKGLEVRTDDYRNRRLPADEEKRIRDVFIGKVPEGRKLCLRFKHRESFIMLFDLALETAMRMREMYTLTFDQVNIEKRTIYLSRTKNGDTREVPLSSVAVRRLTEYFHLIGDTPFGEGQLFPWWNGVQNQLVLKRTSRCLSGQFFRLFESAGCKDLHFHDLRHEAVCRLFERTKLPETLISRISGHRDPKQLRRYASLRGSELAVHLW